MNDEQKAQYESEYKRGQEAKQLLSNPLFKQSFHILQAHNYAAFEATGFKDKEERDEIWRTLKNLQRVEAQLTQIINTGKLAETSLLQKAKDFIKR